MGALEPIITKVVTIDAADTYPLTISNEEQGILVGAFLDLGSASAMSVAVNDAHGLELLDGQGAGLTADANISNNDIGGMPVIPGNVNVVVSSVTGDFLTTTGKAVLYIKTFQ